MRQVFLFFLLLNVGYFIWQSGYFREPTPPSTKEITAPSGVASLTLLRERGLGGGDVPSRPARQPSTSPSESAQINEPPQPAKAPPVAAEVAPPVEMLTPAPTPVPPAPEPVTMACFTFGPFDKEATVAKAFEAITAAGGEVKRRQVEQRTPRAYWVYLPPLESYAAALNKVKELRKKGISDLFIMGKGEKQNAISLGLFSSKATADQRQEEVTALGLQPIMETQYRTSVLEWLDIEVDSKRTSTIATITAIADEYITANLSQRSCE